MHSTTALKQLGTRPMMAKANMTPLMAAAAKVGHNLRQGGIKPNQVPVDVAQDLDALETYQFFYQFGGNADFITCVNVYTRLH
jgi:hypothetical protein